MIYNCFGFGGIGNTKTISGETPMKLAMGFVPMKFFNPVKDGRIKK